MIYTPSSALALTTATAVAREFHAVAGAMKTPGPERCAWRSVTADTRVLPTDCLVMADATGGAITVTLPEASDVLGLRVTVKRMNGGGNAVTVSRSGTDTIDGANTAALGSQYARVTVQAWKDGSSYGWAVVD